MGGAIFRNRLAGCLAVSRAFGDSALKNFGLSAQPHLSKTILKDTDTHLIIACDGVFIKRKKKGKNVLTNFFQIKSYGM